MASSNHYIIYAVWTSHNLLSKPDSFVCKLMPPNPSKRTGHLRSASNMLRNSVLLLTR